MMLQDNTNIPLIASAGTLFGTIVSVFYMLGAKEAANDQKTYVLVKFLGPGISHLPYFFFTIGIVGWAVAILFHVFVTPRTETGFIVM